MRKPQRTGAGPAWLVPAAPALALAVAVAVALALAGAVHAQGGGATPATAPPVRPAVEPPGMVRRTTLIVNDIDASIRFYRDILGFELWLENRGKVTASSLPNEASLGAPSRFAIMKGRHPWIGMVGLLQYGEPRALPPPPKALRPGDSVLMIETRDLAGIYARMQRARTPIHKAPETSEVTGNGGLRWEATFLFAFDPDGHMLEINQRGPDRGSAPASASAAPAVRVQRAFFDGRFGQIHYRRASPQQAGGMRPPVVLLHQSPLSGRMFSELLPQLGTDRVVYAPDTPGYGESDAPPRVPTLGDYADALHDFIADLKEPVDLVGYHTGAMIAAEIAARYPQDIRKLVLISVPVFSAERRAQLVSTTVQAEDGSSLLTEWKSTMGVRPAGQSVEQAARIVAEKQRAGLKAGWAMAALSAYEPEPRLKLIARPTLIMRPKDGLWDAGATAAALIPGAELQDAPEYGFGLFDAFPAEIASRVRRFLDAPGVR